MAGTACALPSGIDSKCTVAFWRASASSNTSADVAQSPAQIRVATLGVAKVGNADSIYAAVSERAGSFAQLRVSRHRKSDGAQVWQKFLPIEANADSWRGVDRFELKLGGDGDPIILLASDSVYFVGHSDARVIKISAGNGDVLWTRELIDSSNGQTDVATFGIASDSSGNVFVPAHERYVEVGNPTISFGKRVLHKLSSSTGASLWQVEFDPHEDFPYYSIPQGYVAGNYYLALESPLPTPQMAWTGIDGATGTVAWSNPDLPIAHPAVIDYSKVVVAVGESELRITRFSPSSGAIVWQTHYDGIFDQNFAMNSGLEDDGAFVLGGSRRTWDFESAFLITRPIVIAIQASNGAIEWVNAFDDFPDARGAAAIKFVADGLVRASRTIVSPAAVPPSQTVIGSELTSLSRLNGSRVGSELLHAVRPSLPHLGFDSNYVISRIEDGNFFTQGDSQIRSPSQFTISAWNVPSTLQIGSLVVSLSTSVDGAGSNVRYSYSFTTENQGGVTAEQVFALLSLPPDSISSGVICTLNGAPCSTVSTASSIEARVDVAPGSVLVLQGSVEVQGGNQAPHELRVTSFAPPGFVEDDLADNVSTFRFTDKIFRNGFE